MALSEAKTLDSERNLIYVKSNAGSRLTGTVTENKNVFDKFPQLNMDKHNQLVDLLIALGLDTIKTDLGDRYTIDETDNLVATETDGLIETVEYTKANGKFKFTTKGGDIITIDTDLEKIPANFSLITADNGAWLRVTNQDGSYSQTTLTSLLNVYNFINSDTIRFTESPKYSVTAVVKPGSILKTHLNSEVMSYLSELTSAAQLYASDAAGYAGNSEISANNASKFATLSKSYAVGGTSSRTGENTDNASYYRAMAQASADAAASDASVAKGYANSAQSYKSQAYQYGNTAIQAANSAETASGTAQTARNAAVTAKDEAVTAKGAAETARDEAVAAKTAAETAKSDAQASAEEAARTVDSKAPLASPAFTGTPTAPTPTAGDDSTKIATTEFVENVKSASLGGLKFSITEDGLLHVEEEEEV